MFIEKLIDPYMSKKEELLKKLNSYSSKNDKTRAFFKNAKKTSVLELKDVLVDIGKDPSVSNVFSLIKTLASTGSWIGTSYIRHLHGLIDFSQKNLLKKEEELKDPRIQKILNRVIDQTQLNDHISDQEIFRSIYNELEYAHHNPSYECPLVVPKEDITIMLVSGVLNEVFSTPAFDRGVVHLTNSLGVKYVSLEAKGTKDSIFNTALLKQQIKEYIKENPEDKIWLIGFSKGGLDALHYLAENSEFAEKHFVGFSTIATPIMGTDHLSHWIMRSINTLHKFSDNKIYQYLDSKSDFLAKDFQKSLSTEYLQEWFKENHIKLPKNIFYTAVAFESSWFESHLWMKVAKLIINSDTVNDGVVDAKNAFFPEYFKSHRLGITKGHHLVGIRSSYYSQEALLEAHLIFLKYKKLL